MPPDTRVTGGSPTRGLLAPALAAFLSLGGCGPSAADLASMDYTPVARDDWPVATPAEVGLDSALLARLYWDAARAETNYAVLVVKDGRLVAERYHNGGGVDTPTNLQSATKSVTSALVGIAVEDGCIPGVDVKVMDYFPELVDSIRDPRKFEITLEHLQIYSWQQIVLNSTHISLCIYIFACCLFKAFPQAFVNEF